MAAFDKQQEIEARTAILKEALRSERIDYDLVHREMARLAIAAYTEIAALTSLRNDIAILNQRLAKFMSDLVDANIARTMREKEAAAVVVQRSEEALTESQKLRAVFTKDVSNRMPPPLPTEAPEKETLKAWFVERVLPGLAQWIIAGLMFFIGLAIWTYFKTQVLKTP